MKYNYKLLRKRVTDIEGGYTTVSREMGISRQRLKTILGGETNPKIDTMKKVHDVLVSLEDKKELVQERYSDIFLP
ncbi:hypothetical protein [Fibrella forsythiae]|uniref:HTH cro/C1-type domain-containing protein n=1 Tax=Fibrella forsythiae TaxID=2817061 RepID=A0ABS3JBJ8_9BACT|nr:hypothetical protein [Fibrella forsythiae]MBO0947355.1 hypothetical protein [Fibrella forsythiae]